MTRHSNSTLAKWIDDLKRKAPEYLDLLTAENDSQFEGAFDALLEEAVGHLESNKTLFAPLDEKGLTAALAGRIMVPGITVTQETHSNGHVDVTIRADHCRPARKRLGEAKIYDGPAYHIRGLEQLLGRYTTGREGRGLLIEYFRQEDIAGLVGKVREHMDREQPCHQKGATTDHTLKWSFLSAHGHSSGETVNVGHIGCNLWIDKAH